MDMIIGAYTPIRFRKITPSSNRDYVQAQLYYAGEFIQDYDWYWKPGYIFSMNSKYRMVIRTPA